MDAFFFSNYFITYVPRQRFSFIRVSKPVKMNTNASVDPQDLDWFLLFWEQYFKNFCKSTERRETSLIF